MSKGEEKIKEILQRARISFETEKTFEDLRGGRYRFDFYIPSRECLIEYQGQQHYQLIPRYFSNRLEFHKAQERDRRKISYCLAHGIYIYCIPYWEIDKIEKAEDLFQNKFLARTKWKNDEDWKRHQK